LSLEVKKQQQKSTASYVISNELVNFLDEILIAIDAGEGACVDSRLCGEVRDQVSCAFADHALHSQLPCSQVNIFDLQSRARVVKMSIGFRDNGKILHA
jgi:hypothetical protein